MIQVLNEIKIMLVKSSQKIKILFNLSVPFSANSTMPSVTYFQNITSWVVALFADWIY